MRKRKKPAFCPPSNKSTACTVKMNGILAGSPVGRPVMAQRRAWPEAITGTLVVMPPAYYLDTDQLNQLCPDIPGYR